MDIIKILAVYAVLHITYVDMGMEIGDKYKKFVRSPWILYPLLLATAYTGMEGDIESTALVVLVFYIMMLWGQGDLQAPVLDKVLGLITMP